MKQTLLRCLLCLLPFSLSAQAPSFLGKLTCDTVPDVFLTLNWRNLIRTKDEKAYKAARLYCPALHGDTVLVQAKVRTRGHMRLQICDFPPLKLKIEKEALAQLQLADFNELDIVHRCNSGSAAEQLILREYLAYKLWEVLSPLHLHTQLIRLHYLDTTGVAMFEPAYAFLVEDENEFAERIGAHRIKANTMHKGALDKAAMLRVCLFQFMIGNTDWYISNSHNLEFMGMPDNPYLQVVPYDFDYAGIVNASYSAHHESIKLNSTTMRYYQGWCESAAEVNQQLQLFLDNKQRILDMPRRIPNMDERSVKYTTDYLQAFFDIIENPKKLESQVIRHCDVWPVRN
jgi:hypothetical protein